MKTFLKALVLLPIAIVAMAFAVANRQMVTISFDPFAAANPTLLLSAPLFLLVFFLLTCGVVIGGIASWLGQGRHRRRARRMSAEVVEARAEIDRLRTELDIQSRKAREEARLAGTTVGRLPALSLLDTAA